MPVALEDCSRVAAALRLKELEKPGMASEQLLGGRPAMIGQVETPAPLQRPVVRLVCPRGRHAEPVADLLQGELIVVFPVQDLMILPVEPASSRSSTK